MLIDATLNTKQASQNIRDEIKQIQLEINRIPLQLRIEAFTGVLKQQATEAAREYKQVFSSLLQDFNSSKEALNKQLLAKDMGNASKSTETSAKGSDGGNALDILGNIAKPIDNVDKILKVRDIPKNVTELHNKVANVVKAFTGYQKILGTTTTATVFLSVATNTLKTTMGALISNPLTWIVVAVGAATASTIGYVNEQKKLKEQTEATNRAQTAFTTSVAEFNKTLDIAKAKEAAQALENLKKSTDYDNSVQKIAKLRKGIAELEEITKGVNKNDSLAQAYATEFNALDHKRQELSKLEKQIEPVIKTQYQYNELSERAISLDYQSAQQNARKIAQKVQEADANSKLVQQYEAIYDKLKDGVQLTDEESQLNEKLINQYPEHVSLLDKKNNVLGVNYEALKNNTDLQILLARVEFEEYKMSIQTNANKTKTLIDETEKRITAMDSEITYLDALMNKHYELATVNGDVEAEKSLMQFYNKYQALKQSLSTAKIELASLKVTDSVYTVFTNTSFEDYLKEISSANSTRTNYNPNSGSSLDKRPDSIKPEIDLYLDLTAAVDEATNALAALKLEEDGLEGQARIDLLEKEIAANKNLAKAKNDLLWQQKKERNDLRYTMSQQGFDFSGDFDSTNLSTNYSEQLTAMYDKYENMADKTEDDKQKRADYLATIKEMEKTYARILQINNDTYSIARDIVQANKENNKIQSDVIKINFEQAESDAHGLDKALEDVNNKLQDVSDDDYAQKIELTNQKWKAANDLLWYWNEQMKLFPEGSEEWNKARENVNKFTKEMNTASKSLVELKDNQIEATKKAQDEVYKLVQKAVEDELDAERTKLEAKKKDLEDEIEARYKADKEHIKSQKETYNKIYDVRKNALQREKDLLQKNQDEKRYQDDLKEKQGELSELQKSYNKIAADNSGTYAKQQADLQKQIADKQKDINEFISDHTIRTQESALDEQIRLLDEEKNAKERAWDNETEALEKSYENRAEKNNQYYNQELANTKLRLDQIKKDSESYAAEVSTRMNEILSSSQDGILLYLISNLEEYKNAGKSQAESYLQGYYETLKNAGITSNTNPLASSTSSNTKPQASTEIKSAIENIVVLKKAWEAAYNRNDESTAQDLATIEKQAKTYYDKLPTMYYDKLKSMNAAQAEEWYRSLPRFRSEGYTGNWSGGIGKLAMVDPEEFILSKRTVSNLLQGNLANILPKIAMPSIPKFNFAGYGGIGNVTVNTLQVKVDRLVETDDYTGMAKQVRNSIIKEFKGSNNVSTGRW